MRNISPSTKVLLGAVIAICIGVWRIFFFFGAYGEVFFEYIFTILLVSLGLFIASFFIPKSERVIGKWGQTLLLIPALWFIIASLSYVWEVAYADSLLVVLTFVILFFSLPYTLYFITAVTQSDILELGSKKLFGALTLIAVLVATIGYLAGKYNMYWLECRDFKVAGMENPLQCYSKQEGKIVTNSFDE